MRIDILTILPEMFEAPMSASMLGIARDKGILELHVHDLRDWTHDRHRTTDDSPYGGGPGMVMKPEPVFAAVREIRGMATTELYTIFLAPSGRSFDQLRAREFSTRERLLFVCGRYEGFDERILTLADEILSIGDYVLTGGELAAMVVADATVRLLPGVLGHEDSVTDESFSEALLEYPHYTRPAEFEGMAVPEVLLSGDHARIARWRREQAILRTARVRPDLLERAGLDRAELELAQREQDRAPALGEGDR
ncbi:MAG: tRNA (guanosine(37)-N1)-methyltransferase TrmD [Coriobacteriia bacterium]